MFADWHFMINHNFVSAVPSNSYLCNMFLVINFDRDHLFLHGSSGVLIPLAEVKAVKDSPRQRSGSRIIKSNPTPITLTQAVGSTPITGTSTPESTTPTGKSTRRSFWDILVSSSKGSQGFDNGKWYTTSYLHFGLKTVKSFLIDRETQLLFRDMVWDTMDWNNCVEH